MTENALRFHKQTYYQDTPIHHRTAKSAGLDLVIIVSSPESLKADVVEAVVELLSAAAKPLTFRQLKERARLDEGVTELGRCLILHRHEDRV